MKLPSKEKLIGLLINISLGILGVWLLLNPKIGVNIFRFYVGIILLIASIILFILYFRSKEKRILFLIQAIASLVVGAVFLMSSTVTAVLLGIILMIWILVEGAIAVHMSFKYKSSEYKYWWISLLYGIAAIGLGIYILFNLSFSGTVLVSIVGLYLLVRSIVEIINLLLYKGPYLEITVKEENVENLEDNSKES